MRPWKFGGESEKTEKSTKILAEEKKKLSALEKVNMNITAQVAEFNAENIQIRYSIVSELKHELSTGRNGNGVIPEKCN